MKLLRKKLKNGMTVIMEKRELPVVSVAVTNRFGAAFEESKIKGIAHVIEHMVFKGTKTRTHEDISREIEKKGGILNAFTSNEVTSFWFKLPSEHLFAGLDIITDIIKNPKFDRKNFEKEKKVILEEIKMYHDIPARNIYDKIFENLYEYPIGEGIIGSKETVSSLDRDFVYNYYKENYQHNNFIISVVGSADFKEICDYFEKNFNFKSKEMKIKEIKKRNADSVEERESIDQAHFILAVHAPIVGDKKYPVLEVLDAYLASGMSSRLFLEIREERGLAYSIRSSIDSEKSYSYYSIYAGTRKEVVNEVKEIIIKEFNKVSSSMTEKDLAEAKQRLVGLRKINSEESDSVMNEITFMELADNIDEYSEHEKRINNVKLEEVKKLASELIKEYSTAAIVPK